MPNVNKRKGKYFEEKIAEDYRKFFKLDKTECYRSGSSGARTSIEYNGDISFSNPNKYRIITECKYYSDMILDHFFPVCHSYIDYWITQVEEEKSRYIQKYHEIPLSIIIAGRPYDKNYHVVIINDNINLDPIKCKLTFYSKLHAREFILINYSDLSSILKVNPPNF